MARVALTTTWSTIGTSKTGAFTQNLGPGLVLVAFAATIPAAGTTVGFLLQAGDYAPVTGLAATSVFARAIDEASDIEVLTTA